MTDATRLLDAMAQGDPRASERLLPLVYRELQDLARQHMRHERAEHTLQATALVHEVYLRLLQDEPQEWHGRRHFFAVAAEAMRRILVEHARGRNAIKRGGGCAKVSLDDEQVPAIVSPCDNVDDLLALNDSLDQLAREDPISAELVKLLYFAGMNLDESAVALGLSRTTAYRRWIWARAWLHDALHQDAGT